MIAPAPGVIDLIDVRFKKEGGLAAEIGVRIHLLGFGAVFLDDVIQDVVIEDILIPADAVDPAFIPQEPQAVPDILDPPVVMLVPQEGAAGTLHIGGGEIGNSLHVFRPAMVRAVVVFKAEAVFHFHPRGKAT